MSSAATILKVHPTNRRRSTSSSSSSSSSLKTTTKIMATTSRDSSSSSSSSWTVTSARNSAIAGYVAGVVGVTIGHPFESAKVWLQTNSTGTNKHLSSSFSTTTNPLRFPPPPSSSTKSVDGFMKLSGFRNINNSNSKSGGSVVARYIKATAMSRGSSTMTAASASATTAYYHHHHHPLLSLSSSSPRQLIIASSNYISTLRGNIRALYSGVGGPLITVGIVQSINFMSYDSLRRILYQYNNKNHNSSSNHHIIMNEYEYLDNDSLGNIAMAGFITGAGLASITAPLIRIKTRQQVTGNGFHETIVELMKQQQKKQIKNGNNNNSITTTMTKRRSNMLRPFLVGFGPHVLSETLGRAIYYAMYESSKRYVVAYKKTKQNATTTTTTHYSSNNNNILTLQDRMLCAGLSGVVSWSIIFPLDSLRSRLYSQGGGTTGTTTIKTAIEMIHIMLYQNNNGKKTLSLRPFFRGYGISVLRAGPVAAAVLPIYDLVLNKLSSSSSF